MTDMDVSLVHGRLSNREIADSNSARNAFVGIARMLSGAVPGTGQEMAVANKGQVLLIKEVHIPPMAATDTSPSTNSWFTMLLKDSANADAFALPVFQFNRDSTFGAAGAYRAIPNTPVRWQPQQPLMIPSGWEINSVCAGSAVLSQPLCYGVQMSEGEARTLGYAVANDTVASGVARRWIQVGNAFAAAGDTVLSAARAGQTILITDILVRAQPTAGPGTLTNIELKDTAGGVIFTWGVQHRANPFQAIIKPRIYLPANLGLSLTIDANVVDRGSIIVLGRYVDNADVPRNCWFSHVLPTGPTPASTATALGVRNVFTVKAAPGKGYQNIVEGYCISMNRDAAGGDLTAVMLSTAAAGATLLGADPANATPTNRPISPILVMASPDQEITMIADQMRIGALPNTGAILFEMEAVGAPGDTNYDKISCTCWGQTVPGDDKDNASNITWIKGRNAT